MSYPKTHLEAALAQYLQTGELADSLIEADEHELQHCMVEVAVIPGYSKSNSDAMWIHATNNQNLAFHLTPGENLARFFTMVNVHPQDVLTAQDMAFSPRKCEPHLDDRYIAWANQQNADSVKQLIDMVTGFKLDETRPPICSADTARAILDNCWGGIPMIAGWASVLEILNLDLSRPTKVAGHYQAGIWDWVNGSGHLESDNPPEFEIQISQGDIAILATKSRWTPDHSSGFVNRFYRLQLQSLHAVEKLPTVEVG